VATPTQRRIEAAGPFLRILVGFIDLEIGRARVVKD